MADLNHKLKKIKFRLAWSLFLIVGLYLGLTFYSQRSIGTNYFLRHMPFAEYDSGWIGEDGQQIESLHDIAVYMADHGYEEYTIHKKLGKQLHDKYLMFLSSNIFFHIYGDDGGIYDYEYTPSFLAGRSYGRDYHVINIPKEYSNAVISIRIKRIYASSGGIDDMFLGDTGAYISYLMEHHLLSFVLSLLIAVSGLLLIVVSMVIPIAQNYIEGMRALGQLAVITGIWTGVKTNMLTMMLGHPEVTRCLDYPMLMLIPYPTVAMVNSWMVRPAKKSQTLILVLELLDIGINIVARVFFGLDSHDMRFAVHFVLLFAVILVFHILLINAHYVSRHKSYHHRPLIVIALFSLVGCAMFDLSCYYLDPSLSDPAKFTRIGYLSFIGLFFIEYVNILGERMKSAGETEMYRRLAYKDELTGIGNRAAFAEKEARLLEQIDTLRPNEKILVAQFDMNNLKKMNDRYGHNIGDQCIKFCSDILHSAFSAKGWVYRVGGDEFTAFMVSSHPEEDYAECRAVMLKKVAEINATSNLPVEFSISDGYAVYDPHAPELSQDDQAASKELAEFGEKWDYLRSHMYTYTSPDLDPDGNPKEDTSTPAERAAKSRHIIGMTRTESLADLHMYECKKSMKALRTD